MLSADEFETRQSCCAARLHLDYRGNLLRIGDRDVVDRQVPRRNIATGFRVARHVLIAHDHDLLRQARRPPAEILDPFDHDRPRSAALQRRFDQHMRVRMIPVQPRRLVFGKMHVVLERVPRIDQRLDHLIRMTGGRSVGAVKVHIERRAGQFGRAAIGLIDLQDDRRRRRIVGHIDNQMVARIDVQRRVFESARAS